MANIKRTKFQNMVEKPKKGYNKNKKKREFFRKKRERENTGMFMLIFPS